MTDTDDGRNVDGPDVLAAVETFFRRYIVLPGEHGFTVLALWSAHTHAIEAFYVTPRLVLDSAEAGSGKTRVLEVLNLFTRQAEMILSPTVAALFRMLADGPLTLLFDEVDAVFNLKNAGNFEDLRGMLNAGYKRGSTIPRCVGDAAKMKVQRFKVFAPVALAGIAGNMPATITTRAITLHMRKRKPSERVEPFRERDAEIAAKPLRDSLEAWVKSVKTELDAARPAMPDGVVDRPSEVWEALLAVADVAGGDWPERARAACRHFVLDAPDEAPTLGVRLLADLRKIYGDNDRMATTDVVDKLVALEESQWASMWADKPIDARRLARELKRYDVASVGFEAPDPVTGVPKTFKGYVTYPAQKQVGLADAWARYLPDSSGKDGKDGKDAAQEAYRGNGLTDGSVSHQDPKAAVSRQLTGLTELTEKSRCTACGEPIDPVLSDATTHPGCDLEGQAA